MRALGYGGPTSDQTERQERRDLGMEDHWDDPANPDYADLSSDPAAYEVPRPVRLTKKTDPFCRKWRRLGWSAQSWGPCFGQFYDGRCTECGRTQPKATT